MEWIPKWLTGGNGPFVNDTITTIRQMICGQDRAITQVERPPEAELEAIIIEDGSNAQKLENCKIEQIEAKTPLSSSSPRRYLELHTHFNGVLKPKDFLALVKEHMPQDQPLREVYLTHVADSVQNYLKDKAPFDQRPQELMRLTEDLKNDKLSFEKRLDLLEPYLATGILQYDHTYEIRGFLRDPFAKGDQSSSFPSESKVDQKENLFGKLPRQKFFESYHLKTLHEWQDQGVRYVEPQISMGFIKRGELDDLAAKGEKIKLPVRALVAQNAKKHLSDATNPSEQEWQTIKQNLLRKDVAGLDFCGPEAKFSTKGMEVFKNYYKQLIEIAKEKKEILVLRPHVGEGYSASPDHYDPELAKTAYHNLELLLETLEQLQKEGDPVKDGPVIIRFGHATHASSDLLERMDRLNIFPEYNLSSNEKTGVIEERDQHQLLDGMLRARVFFHTDAGGVMGTTLPDEEKRIGQFISDFISGKTQKLGPLDKPGERQLGGMPRTFEELVEQEALHLYYKAVKTFEEGGEGNETSTTSKATGFKPHPQPQDFKQEARDRLEKVFSVNVFQAKAEAYAAHLLDRQQQNFQSTPSWLSDLQPSKG